MACPRSTGTGKHTEPSVIDFKKCRDQVLKLTHDWDLDVMESTDQELLEVYDQVSTLAKAGEDGLGNRDYSDLHAAQILEVMIRWELHIRSTGEEAPGMPYDPAQAAAEERQRKLKKRQR